MLMFKSQLIKAKTNMPETIRPQEIPSWAFNAPDNQRSRGFEKSQSVDHESPIKTRENGISDNQETTISPQPWPEDQYKANRDRDGNVRQFPGSFGMPELSQTADHSHESVSDQNQGAA